MAPELATLSITRPKLVRTDKGSRIHCVIHLASARDMTGVELDAVWYRFHIPENAEWSVRRGRVRRRRIKFKATFDSKI